MLESQLTRENYRAKFHQLLCREEEEHERLLAERLALQMLMVLVLSGTLINEADILEV